MLITFSDSAIKKIKQQLTNNNNSLGVRIGVKKTGCSGFMYTIDYIDTQLETDIKIDIKECNIFIDSNITEYLKGTIVDYVRKGLNEGFVFNNPNETSRCGCGNSFTI